jgi:two-component system chemotaxis response regulator CheY
MTKTIIIVDDIYFVRKTIQEILVQAHYQVIAEADNGASAVDLYSKLRPDLVTMDVVMPEMSGIEACQKILKMNHQAKVIMISAMGQESMMMEAIEAGACDYLLKPFTSQDILKATARALQGDQGNLAANAKDEYSIPR